MYLEFKLWKVKPHIVVQLLNLSFAHPCISNPVKKRFHYMIPQAVASVLQFHSAHKNVFLSDCIILLYLLSHLSHSVMPKLCFIEITESNICVATYPHISASPFWRELFLMNVDKLRSLPSPFPWVQCAFHWKYIHPRKGTPPPHTHSSGMMGLHCPSI